MLALERKKKKNKNLAVEKMKTRLYLVVVISLLFGVFFSNASAKFDTEAGIKNFIENFVLSRLPGPTGDAVAIVKDAPAYTKTGLILWLNRKMADAASKGDWKRHDRYLAFYTCLSKQDCDDLRKLQSQQVSAVPEYNITGTWHGGGNSKYLVEQKRSNISWKGDGFYAGRKWYHEAKGTIRGNTVTADWEDLPNSGFFPNKGSVTGTISSDGKTITWTGDFNPLERKWTK